MKQLGKWQHMPVYLKMLMTACTLSCYCPAAVAAESTAKAGSIQQQQDSFSGVVVDEKNDPLIGVTIQVKGTSSRTVTDTDGRFTLPAGEKSATLVVSYVGYSTKEVRVSAGRTVNISLHPDDQTLEEVIVTGYGTFKKSAYAGSASTLKTEKLEDVPTATFKDLLQGAASGVQMSSASGQPGSSVALNIRGMGSFNASNSPLYVIDGVPVMSGNVSANDSKGGFDLMSTLSNTDIESITVIKDAAAASLYGSRAANGVVLITTKKGREGKPVVNLKADWGSSDFAMDYRPVMNGEQRREYIYNALKAGALRDGKSEADAVSYADSEIDNYAPVPWCGYVDWDRILFKKGSHQSYEASVSGGTNRFTYYTSLSYLKQQGIARNSGLERISGRVNAEYKATKKFTLGVKSLFASVKQLRGSLRCRL